jgi:hypothetical protein
LKNCFIELHRALEIAGGDFKPNCVTDHDVSFVCS